MGDAQPKTAPKAEFVLVIKQVKEIRVQACPEEMERFIRNSQGDSETMSSIWRRLEGSFYGVLTSEPVRNPLYVDTTEPLYELEGDQIIERASSEGGG